MWTQQLETMRAFYENYFHGRSSAKYSNPRTGFQSYFLSFENGPRLELMQRPDVTDSATHVAQIGLTHLAMSVGNKTAVDQLTERLRSDGFLVVGEPRTTGDGYYESVILDPDGNRIEITL